MAYTLSYPMPYHLMYTLIMVPSISRMQPSPISPLQLWHPVEHLLLPSNIFLIKSQPFSSPCFHQSPEPLVQLPHLLLLRLAQRLDVVGWLVHEC